MNFEKTTYKEMTENSDPKSKNLKSESKKINYDAVESSKNLIASRKNSARSTLDSSLSYGIKIWTDLFPFCHDPRVWQTDGLTDSLLVARPSCIQCSAVKS